MKSLISPSDHWVIWTSLTSVAALSFYLEQRYKICQKITGALLAMVGGMLLSNIGFLPMASASYDIIWDYIIPLTIPLLLMKIIHEQVPVASIQVCPSGTIRKIVLITGENF